MRHAGTLGREFGCIGVMQRREGAQSRSLERSRIVITDVECFHVMSRTALPRGLIPRDKGKIAYFHGFLYLMEHHSYGSGFIGG